MVFVFFPFFLCECSTTHDPGIHPCLLEMQFHKLVLKALGFSCVSVLLSLLFFSSLRSELRIGLESDICQAHLKLKFLIKCF